MKIYNFCFYWSLFWLIDYNTNNMRFLVIAIRVNRGIRLLSSLRLLRFNWFLFL